MKHKVKKIHFVGANAQSRSRLLGRSRGPCPRTSNTDEGCDEA
jgi:hypothetical protein